MGGFSSKPSSSSAPKKAPPGGTVSATDRAVLDLKNARDRLTRYRTKLDKDQEKLLAQASHCKANGKTSMALQLLRLRKYKLREVDNVNEQLLTVLQMVDTISSKENEKEVFQSLKQGKDALERLHKEITVDDVIKLMDDVAEQNDFEREINDIISQGGKTALSSADEEAALAELDQLEKEMFGEKQTEPPEEKADLDLPAVPTGKLPTLETPSATEEPSERIAVPS